MEGVCFRIMKKFLTYLSLALAFCGFSANLSNVYAVKKANSVLVANSGVEKRRRQEGLVQKRKSTLIDAERSFYEIFDGKSSESPMFLNILYNDEKRQGAVIWFSPTYFIEKFGFEENDEFLKYSVEVVDKDTGLAARQKRGNIFDYAEFFRAYEKDPNLCHTPIWVRPSAADVDSIYIDFYVDKKDGVNKNYEEYTSFDEYFEFKPGKSYIVNFYSDSDFDKKNLKFSCETVACDKVFKDIKEEKTLFAHPKKFNRDYYARLIDKGGY